MLLADSTLISNLRLRIVCTIGVKLLSLCHNKFIRCVGCFY